MNIIKIAILLFMMTSNSTFAKILYDFSSKNSVRDWYVVDDGVMGGRSKGNFYLDKEGHGVFLGNVSLDNYGGFSSIRCDLRKIKVDGYQYVVIEVKGDNKRYQFRLSSSYFDRYVYTSKFFAKNEWQKIRIPLNALEPSFRGRRLDLPNFNRKAISGIGILVGNKTEEDFMLKIKSIYLE